MELKNLHLPEEGDFRGFEVKFYKVDFNTSEELPQTANIAVYQNSTVLISGLAMGTDYKFQYKILSYSGNSDYSNPLQVATPINNSTMDEMRQQIQDEMEGMMDTFRKEFNSTIEAERADFVHKELGKLREISLHGNSTTSGILYVDGYPVCFGSGWSEASARVACKTLGFNDYKSKSSEDFTEITSMSNVMCDGSEPSLFECEYEMFHECETEKTLRLDCSDELPSTPSTISTPSFP